MSVSHHVIKFESYDLPRSDKQPSGFIRIIASTSLHKGTNNENSTLPVSVFQVFDEVRMFEIGFGDIL